MNSARKQIESIFEAAVAAVDPRTSVRKAIQDGARADGCDLHRSGQESSVYLIALGKAAPAMAAGAMDAFGDRIAGGIVVSKEPAREQFPRFRYLEGSHPVPDERSLEAGEAVLRFARKLPESAGVLCLISGGGSALVEALREPFALDDLQAATTHLLRAGAPIEELNAVRSRMSRIKGGGLLAALGDRPVINLIVSDVLGDNVQTIASGSTVLPESATPAEEVAQRYELDITLPNAAEFPVRQSPETRIVANLPNAIEAAAGEAERLGLRPVVLTDRLEGEAREAGRLVATILKNAGHARSPLLSGDCVLLGGETTVTVRGDGAGGRNSEAALAAAIELQGSSGITVGFLATDGDDGVTNAAGGIVDGATISPEDVNRARRALENNDSHGYLSGIGAVWSPGATGTNVNDLVIAIIE